MAFLVFAGEQYYPKGGAYDLLHETDDITAAKSAAREYCAAGHSLWAHVFCTTAKAVVFEAESA